MELVKKCYKLFKLLKTINFNIKKILIKVKIREFIKTVF